MKLLYFAWVRSKIGMAGETVSPPETVRDVAGLLDWLKGRGPGYADALANPAVVRVSVNQRFARLADPIALSDEIGLFPPVTGG
ncbi:MULTISPECIES: MoaD/ThiS family protein [Inquilinus]|jgi:molybdopterin synthase sulfur carrier subunit|uniref:Molybdopterin synthase sulfur carrier subunit n=1 Tax=Inquilinus ginsengisoli TaxID=363840 RepID=A0ABU1JJC2_9PROT|nr:MoaD/ThiS family protein [Inquilinus ginsengisoli]MDR6288703.1 molybdopterin synthase sulfur carrier subunit [Inquilinus ginsengisoli]